MKKNISILLTLVLALMFALAACGTSSNNSAGDDTTTNGGGNDSTNDGSSSSKDSGSGGSNLKLVNSGKFTFAASGEFKPFSFMKGGKMVGYDIAVGQAIAKKLGLEPNQQKAKFATIVSGVKAHRYDAAVASHTITAERKKSVDFTQPYYYSGPVAYVRPDSNVKTKADLKGKKICVSRGSTYVKTAKKYTDNIPEVDSDVVALQSLSKGHYDVVITDQITGKTAIKNGANIKPVVHFGVSKQAVAVPKDRPKLKKAINNALDELKKSGKLKELAEKWVGVDITQPPKDAK